MLRVRVKVYAYKERADRRALTPTDANAGAQHDVSCVCSFAGQQRGG
jgi:hypothetical protein